MARRAKLKTEVEASYSGSQAFRRAEGDTKGFKAAVQQADKGLEGLVKGGALAAAGIAGLGLAFQAVGGAISTVTQLAGEQEAAERQLAATLEATGHAAGLSADELQNMASALQTQTRFGDEAILGAQSLLLTFRQVGGDTFPRATAAILDMSQSMGTDLKSATLQVGKALNDPIRGMSALAEAGITFSESQRTAIRTMQETGDIAGAQAVILAELEAQFGGSAAAAADTFAGRLEQVQNVLGDVGEEIGMQLTPAMKTLAEELLPAIQDAVVELSPEFEDLGDAADSLAASLIPVIENTSTIIRVNRTAGRILRGVLSLGISEAVRAWGDYRDAQNEANLALRDQLELQAEAITQFPMAEGAERSRAEGLTFSEIQSRRAGEATAELTAGIELLDETSRHFTEGNTAVAESTRAATEAVEHYDEALDTLNPNIEYAIQVETRLAQEQARAIEIQDAYTAASERNAEVQARLAAAQEAVVIQSGNYFQEAVRLGEEALPSVNELLWQQVSASNAGAEAQALLGVATGNLSAAQAEAMLKHAMLKIQVDALVEAYVSGRITAEEATAAAGALGDGLVETAGEALALVEAAGLLKTAIENIPSSKTITIHLDDRTGGAVVSQGDPLGGPGISEGHTRQFGGPVSRNRPVLVGEAGPEVFYPNSAGTIVSNDRLGGGLGGVNVELNVYLANQPGGSPQQLAAALTEEIGRALSR